MTMPAVWLWCGGWGCEPPELLDGDELVVEDSDDDERGAVEDCDEDECESADDDADVEENADDDDDGD